MILRATDLQISREEHLRTEVRDLIHERDEVYRANNQLAEEYDRLLKKYEALSREQQPKPDSRANEIDFLEETCHRLESENTRLSNELKSAFAISVRYERLEHERESLMLSVNELRASNEALAMRVGELKQAEECAKSLKSELEGSKKQLETLADRGERSSGSQPRAYDRFTADRVAAGGKSDGA